MNEGGLVDRYLMKRPLKFRGDFTISPYLYVLLRAALDRNRQEDYSAEVRIDGSKFAISDRLPESFPVPRPFDFFGCAESSTLLTLKKLTYRKEA
jgi:hypothetical protein